MTEKTYFNLASSHPTWMITFPKSLCEDVQDVSHITFPQIIFWRGGQNSACIKGAVRGGGTRRVSVTVEPSLALPAFLTLATSWVAGLWRDNLPLFCGHWSWWGRADWGFRFAASRCQRSYGLVTTNLCLPSARGEKTAPTKVKTTYSIYKKTEAEWILTWQNSHRTRSPFCHPS